MLLVSTNGAAVWIAPAATACSAAMCAAAAADVLQDQRANKPQQLTHLVASVCEAWHAPTRLASACFGVWHLHLKASKAIQGMSIGWTLAGALVALSQMLAAYASCACVSDVVELFLWQLRPACSFMFCGCISMCWVSVVVAEAQWQVCVSCKPGGEHG